MKIVLDIKLKKSQQLLLLMTRTNDNVCYSEQNDCFTGLYFDIHEDKKNHAHVRKSLDTTQYLVGKFKLSCINNYFYFIMFMRDQIIKK